jgi:hypothetical protein
MTKRPDSNGANSSDGGGNREHLSSAEAAAIPSPESSGALSSEVRVEIGGFCLKGGCHIWTYEEGSDGCSGWPVYIEIDPEDVHLFPEWVQTHYRYAVEEDS